MKMKLSICLLLTCIMYAPIYAVVPGDKEPPNGIHAFVVVPFGFCEYQGATVSNEDCNFMCERNFWSSGDCVNEKCVCKSPRTCEYTATHVTTELCDYYCIRDGRNGGRCIDTKCVCQN